MYIHLFHFLIGRGGAFSGVCNTPNTEGLLGSFAGQKVRGWVVELHGIDRGRGGNSKCRRRGEKGVVSELGRDRGVGGRRQRHGTASSDAVVAGDVGIKVVGPKHNVDRNERVEAMEWSKENRQEWTLLRWLGKALGAALLALAVSGRESKFYWTSGRRSSVGVRGSGSVLSGGENVQGAEFESRLFFFFGYPPCSKGDTTA